MIYPFVSLDDHGIFSKRCLRFKNFPIASKNLGITYKAKSLTFDVDSINIAGVVANAAKNIIKLSPLWICATYVQTVIFANKTINPNIIEDLMLAFNADFIVSNGLLFKELSLNSIEIIFKGK